MSMVFDKSDKTKIGGPITIDDDDPVTKYQAKSDGRTFWAYNGMEVFYEGERLYGALDEIERLTTECERQVNAKMVLGRSVVRLTAEGARKGAEMADRLGDLLLEREKTRTLTAENEKLQARVEALEGALSRIHDMAERPVCVCGIQTGTAAIKSCASTGLAATEQGDSDE